MIIMTLDAYAALLAKGFCLDSRTLEGIPITLLLPNGKTVPPTEEVPGNKYSLYPYRFRSVQVTPDRTFDEYPYQDRDSEF